jgi:hypothetical protein
MACNTPKSAWKHGLTENGKTNLTFTKPTHHWRYEKIPIPCGQCVSCKLGRAKEKALLAKHEAQMHELNSFITLTYAPGQLTLPASVEKDELQKFIKRLRSKYQNMPFKYLACGEYGDQFSRPHYHVCLFGLDFHDKQFFKKSKKGFDQYISPELSKLWTYGFHTINDFHPNLAEYVARYTLKKVTTKGIEKLENKFQFVQPWENMGEAINKITGEIIDQATYEHYLKQINIEPEFQLQSQSLGKSFYEKYKTDTDKDYFTTSRGRQRVPRAYDKYREAEQTTEEFKASGRPTLEEIKLKREEKAKNNTENRKYRRQSKHIINKQIESNHNRGLPND